MSTKQQIKKEIEKYFELRPDGYLFYGSKLASCVLFRVNSQHTYISTVMRYARELRQEKKINFRCVHPEKSKYRIVK